MSLIGTDKVGDVVVIGTKVKRLDASAAPAFRQEVLEVIATGENRLVLNLAGVEFVDSSGLGSMVSVLKGLGGKGALAICNVSTGVASLFKLTRMDKVFSILPSQDEAVAKVAG